MSSPKHPTILVAGPSRSRGGVTSVIVAHAAMDTWEAFGCRRLNTFTDGSRWRKAAVAIRAYLAAPLAMSGCGIVHVHVGARSSIIRKLPLLALAKALRKSTILHVHTPDPETMLGDRPNRSFRLACRFADHIVALSPWWRAQLRAAGVEKPIEVIPNPVPIPSERALAGETGGPARILYVGKLEPRKGYSDLLHAAAIVLRSAPQTKFVFAGHGEIDKARSVARDLGIQPFIRFAGWQDADALKELYREATLLCLPSYHEGLPMSVLEAMSWGLPVVATPVGGVPDILVNGVNGFLVKAGQVELLAEKLLEVLRLPAAERRGIGAAGRATVVEHCEPRTVSMRLAALYTGLLNQEPARQP